MVQTCAICARGLNRSAVGQTAISAWGRPQPLAAPALTSLVACPSALRRAILRQGDAGWRLRSTPSLRGGLAHRLACAPYPSIQSTYSKGRASRGFVLRGCIRKAVGARCEAALGHGLADTRFCRKRTSELTYRAHPLSPEPDATVTARYPRKLAAPPTAQAVRASRTERADDSRQTLSKK